MFIITGAINGIVWDAETNKPLIKFNQGIAITEVAAVAKRLESLGYKVEEDKTDKMEKNKKK